MTFLGLFFKAFVTQETIIEAALTGDKDLAFRAFASDPLMHRVGIDQAWKMFNQMLAATHFKFGT